jgi:hypothetical protein
VTADAVRALRDVGDRDGDQLLRFLGQRTVFNPDSPDELNV